jgi:hypothetical protein
MNHVTLVAGSAARFRQKAIVCWFVRYTPTFDPYTARTRSPWSLT